MAFYIFPPEKGRLSLAKLTVYTRRRLEVLMSLAGEQEISAVLCQFVQHHPPPPHHHQHHQVVSLGISNFWRHRQVLQILT